MSKTTRRKNATHEKYWTCSVLQKISGTYVRVPYALNSKAYKKSSALFHSDAGTYMREPGPSWFRNLTAERPHRREAKVQLHKFSLNEEYEVIIRKSPKLEYYT